MAAASYHPRILIPKYEQTDNVKPLTANRGLQFAVGWPNLDLKVSIETSVYPEKWASTCSLAILDYTEWLGFSDLSHKATLLLSRITRAGIQKNQIQGILKVSYCLINFWQHHSNDFRLQSVVDLRCYEYDFCSFYSEFYTQTYVVFLLF